MIELLQIVLQGLYTLMHRTYLFFFFWHNSSIQEFLTVCRCNLCCIWPDKLGKTTLWSFLFFCFLVFLPILRALHETKYSVLRSTQSWIIAQTGRPFVSHKKLIQNACSFSNVGGGRQVYFLSSVQSGSYETLSLCHSIGGCCLSLLSMLKSA